MTVEEIEIIVTARMEEVMKEIKKVEPQLKEMVKKVKESMANIDTKQMTNKINQAVQFIKTKIADLKKSSKNNEIKLTVNNKEASEQITQLEKEIDSLQKKINARQMKLNITNDTLDKIRADTNQAVIKEMPDAGNKKIKQETYNRLDNNTNYTSLISQSDKLNQEIIKYNALLESAKGRMSELGQETEQTGTSQNKLSSFFNAFKGKLEQAKGSVKNFKGIFQQIPKITQNITNNIKGMGKGLKSGLGHILKYAGALFSLRGIYSILSSSAQSWLSSQNAEAQQLSANIEYMKNAMGSALAPVIQFVTNLVYQLMKAIQSVVYALFRVNIFANASAKSMGNVAGNTKKATKEAKQLAGIHDEINNVQENDNSNNGGAGSGSVEPSFDLSKIENTSNSIIDVIKNGNWEEVGSLLGEKLNNALDSIPWNKIQNTAKSIATNIAQFLNGFIGSTDWDLIGNTFAQGLNTAIYFAYNFITTFKWNQFGKAIGDGINEFIQNIDWATAGQTLGNGIIGIFNSISTFLATVDWNIIGESVKIFIQSIDWAGIWEAIKETIKNAIGSVDIFLTGLFGENTATIIEGIIATIGGFIVALQGLSIISEIIEYFNKIRTAIEQVQGAFEILSEVFTGFSAPILIVIGAIAALVVGLVYVFTTNEDVRNSFQDIINTFVENLQPLFQLFTETIIPNLQNAWNGLMQILQPLADFLTNMFTSCWNDFIIPALQYISETVLPTVISTFENLWNNVLVPLGSFIGDVLTPIIKIISDVLNILWKNVVVPLGNALGNILSKAFEGVSEVLNNTVIPIVNAVINVFQWLWNNVLSPIIDFLWNNLKPVFETVFGAIGDIINGLSKTFGGLIDFITGVFSGNWSKAWEGIKNIVSGIWDAIWGAIKGVINSILGGIEGMANGVIKGINWIIKALNNLSFDVPDWVPMFGGKKFGFNLSTLNEISMPRLAKGGVLFEETAFIGGEYQGASSNPEIVTPENIMYETTRRAIEDAQFFNSNNDGQPIYLTINVGNKKLGQILLDDLRDKVRHTGKDIEALVGG